MTVSLASEHVARCERTDLVAVLNEDPIPLSDLTSLSSKFLDLNVELLAPSVHDVVHRLALEQTRDGLGRGWGGCGRAWGRCGSGCGKASRLAGDRAWGWCRSRRSRLGAKEGRSSGCRGSRGRGRGSGTVVKATSVHQHELPVQGVER